jgi:hypothetical protein
VEEYRGGSARQIQPDVEPYAADQGRTRTRVIGSWGDAGDIEAILNCGGASS